MNPIIRNILAVLVGFLVGSAVNMGLIMSSSFIIPPPEGVDVSNMESLKSNMHLFQTKHFVFPFLAHAIGTLIGSTLAALIAATRKFTFSMVIGIAFLIGGIVNVFMLPAPLGFEIFDILAAYIPMGYLGWKLGDRSK